MPGGKRRREHQSCWQCPSNKGPAKLWFGVVRTEGHRPAELIVEGNPASTWSFMLSCSLSLDTCNRS